MLPSCHELFLILLCTTLLGFSILLLSSIIDITSIMRLNPKRKDSKMARFKLLFIVPCSNGLRDIVSFSVRDVECSTLLLTSSDGLSRQYDVPCFSRALLVRCVNGIFDCHGVWGSHHV